MSATSARCLPWRKCMYYLCAVNPLFSRGVPPTALNGRKGGTRNCVPGVNSSSKPLLRCLQVIAAPPVEIVVRVAHGIRPTAAEHDLHVDRCEAVVLVAMDHAGRTADAFPWSEPRGEALAALVLDEDIEKSLQHEEAFLDLMRVRGVALAGLDVDDRQREVAGRDDGRIGVLARTAGTDETVLRAPIALDLGVLERGPVRLLVAEAADVLLHDLFERHADELGRTLMPCNTHARSPFC